MNFHREPSTFVGQVNINVTNLERSLQFYQEVIGFKILERFENQAILTADGKTPLLTIEQPDNVTPQQPRTTGLYHFALLLPKRADLAQVVEHFITNRYAVQGASDHLVSEALYLGDPDGNGIEIYADRPETTWRWADGEVAMTTEPLDIEDLLTEVQGGVWNGLASATVMGHIHLHVSELQKTEEFYNKGLGFDVVTRYGNQALFMSTSQYHHHIGLNTWAGVGAPTPPANSVGLNWYSLVFPSEEARKETIVKLKSIGALVHEENGIVLTKDPSGNHIRLMV
ncbi:VOC family protein [Paenibacillus pini]|uniref:Glyoxalase family protein n=1 Tax=Paenibacillus pini JCM 16418 TaxID=1236976 RepID=W7YPB9_9BACL|nr:VOC family protein [Paenibacillus pini]GAF06531.1 glyoxalase family protein [Paenibacillus pini JCM 16418]